MARDRLDRYYTPYDVALHCCALIADHITPPESVMDPAAGRGDWLDASGEVWGPKIRCFARDVDPEAPAITSWSGMVADYLDPGLTTSLPKVDLVLGNPPYCRLEPFLKRPRVHARAYAWLLRGTALGSARRAPFWRNHPPAHVWVLSERVPWEGPGGRPQTDTVDAYLCLWHVDTNLRPAGPAQLRWTSWR